MGTFDLRDAFHTLRLAAPFQKYYLQIWQQFVDLVFQDDLIKRKQYFDVIMDNTLIHSTADEHMDNLLDLFKVL